VTRERTTPNRALQQTAALTLSGSSSSAGRVVLAGVRLGLVSNLPADDLIKVWLQTSSDTGFTLKRGDASIRVWKDANKSEACS
jgi:hypothetical protein